MDNCIDRYLHAGVSELVIKLGSRGCILVEGNSRVEVPLNEKLVDAVDTTAAGDSFNAGYIAARGVRKSSLDSILIGHACAAQVVQHQGAIVPFNKFDSDIIKG